MRLKSINLSGFMGVPFETPLILDDLAHRNIFIGTNNAGKSILFRFLYFIKSTLLANQSLTVALNADQLENSSWWHHQISTPIHSELTIQLDDSDVETFNFIPPDCAADGLLRAGASFHHDKIAKLHLNIASNNERSRLLDVTPLLYIRNGWHTLYDPNGGYIKINGQRQTPQPPSDLAHIQQKTIAFLSKWIQRMRFFDAVRAINRPKATTPTADDDGSALLKSLYALQNNSRSMLDYGKFNASFIDEMNQLLVPSGIPAISSFRFVTQEVGNAPTMIWHFSNEPNIPIDIHRMGSGMAELAIATASMIQDAGKPMQYFVEEPECHLHPALLRRFVLRLQRQTGMQFFITSHSSVLLDSLTNEDRVFHFKHTKKQGCRADAVQGITAHHRILDDLGVSGSTLIQSNCVIWVEGPSDRLYVRAWLNQLSNAKSFQEGSDYSFAFYGGKVLSHFCFLADNEKDVLSFIQVLKINRFSAILMDRDCADGVEEFGDTKRRIIDAAKMDESKRMRALFSKGREIENDVPIELFRIAVAKMLNRSDDELSELVLTGKKRYPQEVIDHLKLTGNDAKKAVAKLKDKVELAHRIIGLTSDKNLLTPPPYMESDIIPLIQQSRLL
jgi:predicted ATPase